MGHRPGGGGPREKAKHLSWHTAFPRNCLESGLRDTAIFMFYVMNNCGVFRPGEHYTSVLARVSPSCLLFQKTEGHPLFQRSPSLTAIAQRS